MSNFAWMPDDFRQIAEAAGKAESHIHADPRAACFYARFGLESIVHWMYRHDPGLRMPYDNNLGALLHEPSFQNLVPEKVFQKARVIQRVGNDAAHSRRAFGEGDGLQSVKELHHVCWWLVRTYAPEASREGAGWQDERVPRPVDRDAVVPRAELEALEARLAERSQQELERQKERDALDAELQAVRAELAEVRAAQQETPDTHDYSEAETREYLIDLELRRAGWPLDQKRDREYRVDGMPNAKGHGYVDYVLWGDDGRPLAVVEAKKTLHDAEKGRQQAKLYADCLEKAHGRRPIIFYTNGYVTWIWDDLMYPPRRVAGFYKKDELERLIVRRTQRQELDVADVKQEVAGRYYQKRAIGSIASHFSSGRRKALLVMATGTGKTRTAIALVDLLQRAGWVKRALFLADRVSLVNQAVNAFKAHLPESSPVNLVSEKDQAGRVYVCTYPTMMNLIDEADGGEAAFGVGHFDLIVIDEAHRSVYQKYGGIFRYFDSLLVGLTATPSEHVDRNTYELFDLEDGVPTDAYELETAVKDGFLVPPRVQQVDLRFPREGISYDDLSEEEKEQWESLDWGDGVGAGPLPDRVNASAINNWLFNRDTVDKVLEHLMVNGHTVEGGDQLAKTILFARNHQHAKFIEQRFDHHYPEHKGHFARVIDNYATYPQSILDDFSDPAKQPHLAISIDMLDTGVDIPEVANLVFFKPVYSRIKFWQMIGRGTRLRPDLFGPGQDKQDFRVFDFCFNFDFFRENPDGIERGGSAPLGVRLFNARVRLLATLQNDPKHDENGALADSLSDGLHDHVYSMNRQNFLVRERLEAVDYYSEREAWKKLEEEDVQRLEEEVADLPAGAEDDKLESRMFDLTLLRMQLAQVEGNAGEFEARRQRVVEIAMLLEDKASIPAVKAQIELIRAVQDFAFWEGVTLETLEDVRVRLRGLVPFLDRHQRKLVYTDFQDEIVSVRDDDAIVIPKMTGLQYEKKVREYLKAHDDHIAIHRLRRNEPLTPTDLESLEDALKEIGDQEGEALLTDLLARSEAPSLAHFVRRIVGLDRAAAQAAFADFLGDRSLTAAQIRFVETIIDQLTARGVIEAGALYEPPFTSIHAGGPDALFAGKGQVIDDIFERVKRFEDGLPRAG